MDELFSKGVEWWLDAHPHICSYLFVILLTLNLHHYYQTWSIRKVLHMRKGDGWWLRGPRKQPPKPELRRTKSQLPPDPSSEPTPKD